MNISSSIEYLSHINAQRVIPACAEASAGRPLGSYEPLPPSPKGIPVGKGGLVRLSFLYLTHVTSRYFFYGFAYSFTLVPGFTVVFSFVYCYVPDSVLWSVSYMAGKRVKNYRIMHSSADSINYTSTVYTA
jgi:hypothetical protein